MTDREDDARASVLAAARGILNRSVGMIEGCRVIARQRHRLRETRLEDAMLLPILVLDSETEDVPAGREAAMWDDQARARKLQDVEPYLVSMGSQIDEACVGIIAALTESSAGTENQKSCESWHGA